MHRRIDIKPLNFDKFSNPVRSQKEPVLEKSSSRKLRSKKSLKSSQKLEDAIQYSKATAEAAMVPDTEALAAVVPTETAAAVVEESLTVPKQSVEIIVHPSKNKEAHVPNESNSSHINFRLITEEEVRLIEQQVLFSKYSRVPAESCMKLNPNHVQGCWCPKCRVLTNDSGKLRAFKLIGNSKLILNIMAAHNVSRTEDTSKCNLLWSNQHLKSSVFRSMQKHQKINLFPRSYECTRKDAMSTNINAMAEAYGKQHFSFLPECYVWPREREAVVTAMRKSFGKPWILKPAGSSQGRGISIITAISQLPVEGAGLIQDDNWVVERYIDNPLLIDSKKFDLRLYVCVTSFNPLRIYLHEDGLARFATEKYTNSAYANPFVHLTNYSINKHNRLGNPSHDDEEDFKEESEVPRAASESRVSDVENDEEVEIGVRRTHKKLIDDSASNNPNPIDNFFKLRRHFRSGSTGLKCSIQELREKLRALNIDDGEIWMNIEEIIIKTLMAVELKITAAMDMFVAYPDNCFELFGFDILVDAGLKPWLMEVNFSPSLNTDSKLDFDTKNRVLVDTFNLVGIRNDVVVDTRKKDLMAESIQQFRQQQLDRTQNISTLRFQAPVHDKKVAESAAAQKVKELAAAYQLHVLTPVKLIASVNHVENHISLKSNSSRKARPVSASVVQQTTPKQLGKSPDSRDEGFPNGLAAPINTPLLTPCTKSNSRPLSAESSSRFRLKQRPDYTKTNHFRETYKQFVFGNVMRSIAAKVVNDCIETGTALACADISKQFANAGSSVVWNDGQFFELRAPRHEYSPSSKKTPTRRATPASAHCASRKETSMSSVQRPASAQNLRLGDSGNKQHDSIHTPTSGSKEHQNGGMDTSSNIDAKAKKLLIKVLKEFQRSREGGFNLLFPSTDGYKYLPFLSSDRPNNVLLSKYMFCMGIAAATRLSSDAERTRREFMPEKQEVFWTGDREHDEFQLSPSPIKGSTQKRASRATEISTPTSPFQHLKAAPEAALSYGFDFRFEWKETLRVPFHATVLGCVPPPPKDTQVAAPSSSCSPNLEHEKSGTYHGTKTPAEYRSGLNHEESTVQNSTDFISARMKLRFAPDTGDKDSRPGFSAIDSGVTNNAFDFSCLSDPNLEQKWARAIGISLR